MLFGKRAQPWTGPKRVILHCGFRKTGTTTIQEWMRLNAAQLPDGFVVSARDELTQPFRQAVSRHIRKPDLKSVEREAQALRVAIEGMNAETVLVSDENLFGRFMMAEDGRDIFDLAAEILPLLERAFGDAPLEFVFYTREQDRWLRSAWAQDVKRAGVSQPFDQWRSALSSISWETGLARITGALNAPVHVFRMEDDLSASDPLMGRALFGFAGLSADQIATSERPGRENESLSAAALNFLLKVNALGLAQDDRRKVARLVEENRGCFVA
ncbi:MAG: hypothetical protein JJ877_10190 [Thalassococcus sp.]|uniref:hypothetical protein n=1 Tax=Thalassococcus sp. TaxID=1928858 RepID=UPI001B240BAC|nr:hypothetical protein [Thalassococcus sp.]MBO6867401.1 hypothetical protein [Thalassococcus sp.]